MHNGIGRRRERPQNDQEHRDRFCQSQSNAIRGGYRNGLGHDFGKDHHKNGHSDSGVNHALATKELNQYTGGKGGCANVDDIIANQQSADQFLAHFEQTIDALGFFITRPFERMHTGARGAGERGFPRRKYGREKQTKDDYGQSQPGIGLDAKMVH